MATVKRFISKKAVAKIMIYECQMHCGNTVDEEGKVCSECKQSDRYIEEDNLFPNPITGKIEQSKIYGAFWVTKDASSACSFPPKSRLTLTN